MLTHHASDDSPLYVAISAGLGEELGEAHLWLVRCALGLEGWLEHRYEKFHWDCTYKLMHKLFT